MANIKEVVKSGIKEYSKDSSMMLDIIRYVQDQVGSVSDEAIGEIAQALNVSKVDVDGVVSFYHFFSKKPVGKYAVYLNNSVVSDMMGRAAVAKAFEQETGCSFGNTSDDARFGLYYTSCIGMNDQEPAAIINGIVFTSLTPEKVKDIVSGMKEGKEVQDLVRDYGDSNNQSELVRAMVKNNIQHKGHILFKPYETGTALKKAVEMSRDDVIGEVKSSNLRGRGGAGFPTGMKWEFCKAADGKKHYVICNADEGEPGTFKDRVILTEMPKLMFEGMIIGGYAVGAEEGVLYLRAEYEYLKDFLENVLTEMRGNNLLGKDIVGKKGFDFDISIKLGAGAYVCGEESALIESAEGKRGEPRNRPPFPVQQGYKGFPTTVNNVETFCKVTKILADGAEAFASIGTVQSAGTKLLSVSGDCAKPGIYEVDFGVTVADVLKMSGARDTQAVVIGGPSGNIIGKDMFGNTIGYANLSTGGSFIIISNERDLLEIVHNFMEFFVEESCGWCVPCRAGNVLLKNKLEKIISGNATAVDLKDLSEWGATVKAMSRCGLGQTSPNPILTTLEHFKDVYEAKIQTGDYATTFDLNAAVRESCETAGRKPNLGEH